MYKQFSQFSAKAIALSKPLIIAKGTTIPAVVEPIRVTAHTFKPSPVDDQTRFDLEIMEHCTDGFDEWLGTEQMTHPRTNYTHGRK